MKMKCCLLAAAALLPSLLFCLPAARAEAPYQAYVYDEWGKSKAAPTSYVPAAAYTGADAGVGHFDEPQDLFAAEDGFLYIADTGNDRIVKVDERFQAVEAIESFRLKGSETALKEPAGVFVRPDGAMYVADRGNGRVLRVGPRGEVELVIEKPRHALIPDDFAFKPVKVTADRAGRIYVLSEGQYFGLMQFDRDGAFLGYFGSNKVEVTPAVLVETFWKRILSKEQREGMAKLLPIEYSNVTIGGDGFVYTTTVVTKNSREEIKKLNPLGNNVLLGRDGRGDFGDREVPVVGAVALDTSFVDLDVDRNGFIAGLDRTRGRVFEYDQEGNPVAVFGALGNQQGTFLQPAAVAYWGDAIVVLDAGKRNVTAFRRTEYGELVYKATLLYNEGLYEQAADVWRDVVVRNVHNRIAYVGIAKALEKQGDYRAAMHYYKLGADRSGYSDSFAYLRIDAVRANLPIAMTALLAAIAGRYAYKAIRALRAALAARAGAQAGPRAEAGAKGERAL
ncbi:hypothetical protein [Paenibacillus sp.]|uniref:hypothetical protein n=1 Tax=Paenibacillus sp. TaxID=58172 RepID=UPI002D5806D4|nr:hypothetical protein [Paenibacillus sp.]HZG85819.1 hypothetical protein [Paenibacillus sp.]